MQYINFEPWPQLYCKSWTPVPEICPCVFFTPHLPIRSPLLSPYLLCPLILSSLPLFLLSHPLPRGGPPFSSTLCPCSSPLSSHAPQISMAVADSDFASKMKNRQMGSSGGMNMTKSTSISGDMCNLEKTDGSQSDTAVGTVGTDDKKRRSSIGAKMQAMVGMSRKSRSTSQLSQTGREETAQSANCSYVCTCIVLCSLCVLFSVLHRAYCCSDPTAPFLPSTFFRWDLVSGQLPPNTFSPLYPSGNSSLGNPPKRSSSFYFLFSPLWHSYCCLFNARRRGVTKPRLSSVISFRQMCSCNGCVLPASAARHRSRFVTIFMMCCSIELNFFHYLSLLVSAAAPTSFY